MGLTPEQIDLWRQDGRDPDPQPAHERMSLEQARNVEITSFQIACSLLLGAPGVPDDNDVREHMGWPLIDLDSPDPALRAAAEHEQAWKSRLDA